ncbi:hypothetical protein M8818_002519 [Zalaria obscura]|uniref:Uncharacterized protein n=1 Tax=Zalaria obscura TaxID=2024903 RepID=A0ACC3SI56_9PEZI
MLSRGFPDADKSAKFTELNRAPSSIFLRWKDGTYAIDADKEHDSANVLMLLGKSMEKLLTMDTSDFERYRKSDPRGVTQEEREDPESYHYSTQGDFLMRSQLDAHDPRLPGTGMFDLKTRAVVSIRMRSSDYEDMSGYEIQHQHGHFESYEREYYDMMRSTLLKYSLQARMGRMDGIFVAYHNVKRIFGFQYLSINEIDRALHGQLDRCLGDQEFLASIELLNKALDAATKRFPEQGVGAEEPGWEAVDEQVEEDIAKDGASPAREEQENTASVGQALTPTKANEVGASENPAASDDDSNRAADTSPTESSLPAEQPAESATEKSAEDYSTTESAADRPFLSANKPDTLEEDLRPLLAFTLTVRNRVNGSYIDRPKKLEPTDEWKVEYVLKEFSRPSNAWSLYEATKARRAAKYGRFSAADDDEGLNESYYIRMLRQLSQKGRELRAQMDEADQDKAKVVVGHAMSECSDFRQAPSFKVAASPDMASVEDYLAWLYKKESGVTYRRALAQVQSAVQTLTVLEIAESDKDNEPRGLHSRADGQHLTSSRERTSDEPQTAHSVVHFSLTLPHARSVSRRITLRIDEWR